VQAAYTSIAFITQLAAICKLLAGTSAHQQQLRMVSSARLAEHLKACLLALHHLNLACHCPLYCCLQMRSKRNFCIDIVLVCILLGIGAYIFTVATKK
jgi:multisubunit Na+/H+ antiporter MnhF subunit